MPAACPLLSRASRRTCCARTPPSARVCGSRAPSRPSSRPSSSRSASSTPSYASGASSAPSDGTTGTPSTRATSRSASPWPTTTSTTHPRCAVGPWLCVAPQPAVRPGSTAPRHHCARQHCAPAPLCPCARRSRRARDPDVPPWPHTGALGRPALHLWRDHVRRAHHRQQGPAAVLGVPEHLPARGAARVAPVLPVVRGAAAARARAVPRVHRGAPRHRDARRVRAAHQLGDQLHDAPGTPAPTPDP